MIIEVTPVGPLQVNCYVLGCEKSLEGVVIDVGGNVDRVLSIIKKHDLAIRYLLDTHGHFDHVGGNRAFLAATKAHFMIHERDSVFLGMAKDAGKSFGVSVENSPPADSFLTPGKVIKFGEERLEIIHTPGHSPGSCCIYNRKAGVLFTGDTIFNGGVGRTDLPGGSLDSLKRSIRERLAVLPDGVKVYPGHGVSSTIAIERFSNPFFR